MVNLIDRKTCTACGACMSICPKQCIEMETDQYGFYYPIINKDICIECGLCNSVCPVREKKYKERLSIPKKAYVIQHGISSVLENSTSGGAFTALVEALWNDYTVVYGAYLNNKYKVSQTRIDRIDELGKIRKSKYVESYSGKIFISVKKDLEAGKRVIYSGTPCQIAGLYSFLGGRNYEDLYTIEIICHGVPTSLLLEKYIEYQENKYKAKILDIEFRSKETSDWTNPKILIKFSDGKKYCRKSYAGDDEYMIAFCDFLSLRENCGKCVFATPKRGADFTIGDFWGVESSGLDIKYNKGISVICANTNMAVSIVNQMCNLAYIHEVDYTFVVEHNHQLKKPTEANPLREVFLNDLVNKPFEDVRKKYLKPRSAFERMLSNILSRNIKDTIKKILGRKTYKL